MQGTIASQRMAWGDYATVYGWQTLQVEGIEGEVPSCWRHFLDVFHPDTELINAAMNAASELFGKYPYSPDGDRLYDVEKLTLAESAIAARIEMTHAEKIEAIRPLREKRRVTAEKRPYRPSKWEREFRENERRRAVTAVAEALNVTDDDLSWARACGLSLA